MLKLSLKCIQPFRRLFWSGQTARNHRRRHFIVGKINIKINHLILFITDIFSAIKIEDLIIPEVVQKGIVSSVVLDCVYNVVGDGFTLSWLFKQRPVYEWRPPADPIVRGILDGRLDLTYKASGNFRYSLLVKVLT